MPAPQEGEPCIVCSSLFFFSPCGAEGSFLLGSAPQHLTPDNTHNDHSPPANSEPQTTAMGSPQSWYPTTSPCLGIHVAGSPAFPSSPPCKKGVGESIVSPPLHHLAWLQQIAKYQRAEFSFDSGALRGTSCRRQLHDANEPEISLRKK